jgi:hypothetical protein
MDMSKPAPKPTPSVSAAKNKVATTKAKKQTPAEKSGLSKLVPYSKDWFKAANSNKYE